MILNSHLRPQRLNRHNGLFFVPAVVLLLMAQQVLAGDYVVKSRSLQISLSPDGAITSLAGPGGWTKRVTGSTVLDSCEQIGTVAVSTFPHGGVEFRRSMALRNGTHRCTISDRFTPDGNAIRWVATIEGLDSAWATGIGTNLKFEGTPHSRFWTTWGTPGHISPADWGGEGIEWHNPFQSQPFRDMHLVYGGHFGKGAGYSIPVFSVQDSTDGSDVALLMSPEDPLLDVHMLTTKDGGVNQVRRFNRIERGRPLKFTTLLYAPENDWRSVLAFVVERYPRYFKPQLKSALNLCALGAYSSNEVEFDSEKYKRMGGLINWKASFDFSYMGMFLGMVPTDTSRWRRFDVSSEGKPIPGRVTYTSIAQMASYSRGMKARGFATLNYFNITEFGGCSSFADSVLFPRPVLRREEDVWQNPTAFLYDHFPGALLFPALDHAGWNIRTPRQHMDSPVKFRDRPFWTWGGAIVTDVGDSSYAEFLLDQARRHMKGIPDAQGICIDRLDWLNEFNWHADDGRSWVGGRPARSLLNSFKGFMPRLSAIMHKSNKAIFCNPHMNRFELMEHFDGVYNEFGHIGHDLNVSAFLCMFKPLVCWTPDKETVLKSPDEFFQHHILMGAYPTAPFEGNDHCIGPDPTVDRYYLDYGPMFTAMHGRRWVLLPHAVEVTGGSAVANVFTRGTHEVLIPVMLGDTSATQVALNHCRRLLNASTVKCEIWYPGAQKPEQRSVVVKNDRLTLPVPLKRGCAFVVLKPA
jgi:hypothetical protein